MDLVVLEDDDCKYTPIPDQPCKFTKIIAGGHMYSTTEASLCRSPVLADIFGKCNDGEIIRLDMDPKYFSIILSYLRTGVVSQGVRLVDIETMQYYADYLNVPEIMHPLYDSMKRNLKLLPKTTSISRIDKILSLRHRIGLCEDVQLVEGADISGSFSAHFKYDADLHCYIPSPERNYIVITQKEGDDIPTLYIIFCMNIGTAVRPNLEYIIFDSEFSQIEKAVQNNIKSKCDELFGGNLIKYESWSVGKIRLV